MSEPHVRSELEEHESESGLVTRDELEFVSKWVEAFRPDAETEGNDGEWLDGWLSTELPFRMEYAGRNLTNRLPDWTLEIEGIDRDGASEYSFSWTDPDTDLRLTWELAQYTSYPAVEWVFWLENTGSSDTPLIENIQTLSTQLSHSVPDGRYTIHGAHGGRVQRNNLAPFSRDIPSPQAQSESEFGSMDSTRIRLGGDNPSSNRHLPFFNIESPDDRGMLVGVGWSGRWLASLQATDDGSPIETRKGYVIENGRELDVDVGLKEASFALHPGERIRTPRILSVLWQGDRLHGHNVFRRLLESEYVGDLPGDHARPPVSANTWYVYDDNRFRTGPEMESVAGEFLELGVEVFTIDAEWFDGSETGYQDGCGTWTIDRDRYPEGFEPIAARLREDDAELGVWFRPERVGKNSPLHSDHPDWIKTGMNDDEVLQYHAASMAEWEGLRVEDDEAREWFLDRVDDLIENEGVGSYRDDGYGPYGRDPSSRMGLSEIKHYMGLYDLWDELVERHPDVLMDGCCGGGRRIDLETVSRFHWNHRSDRWFDSESDQSGLYGGNLYLPGGYLHVPMVADDEYAAWSCFGGQLCLGWDPNDDRYPKEEAKKHVSLYKEVRHLLGGDFYPLTPPGVDRPWVGYQFHRPDLDEGFALLFKRPHANEDRFAARLRGIDPGDEFAVQLEATGDEERYDGSTLSDGIRITLRETPAAELIRYASASPTN